MQRPSNPEGPRPRVSREGRAPIDARLAQAVSAIGLGEMRPDEVQQRYDMSRNQLRIGLDRSGPPTMNDGGLLAIRSGITPVTPELWTPVPVGKSTLVSEFGGTNHNVSIAEKQRDGSVTVSAPVHTEAIPQAERQAPFGTWIDRIAQPLLEQQAKTGINDFGMSVGLKHSGVVTEDGIDADFLTQTGVLDKGVAFTDWDQLPPSKRRIVKAVRNRMGNKGIGVATNDTVAVATDGGAIEKAQVLEQPVLEAGFVAGTGTNKTLKKPGESFINTEAGRTMWPETEVGKRMRQRQLEQGLIGPENDVPELEFETGQALPKRLAAGVEILSERGFINIGNVDALVSQIEQLPHLSDLATGKERLTPDAETNALLERLAQAAQRRAEQVYGIFYATASQAVDKADPSATHTALTEGSTILRGMRDREHTLREGAEAEAAKLGENITVFPASGMAGVASIAMTLSESRRAA